MEGVQCKFLRCHKEIIMPTKKQYYKSNKKCPDCGILIGDKSQTCHPCNRLRERIYSSSRDISDKKYHYLRHHGIRERLKNEIYSKLGDKCSRCGFSDPRALHIDHVNNDGYADRFGIPSSSTRYRAVIADNSNRYQILCANCNFIKKHEVLQEKLRMKYGQI